jgi:hypothetical protein
MTNTQQDWQGYSFYAQRVWPLSSFYAPPPLGNATQTCSPHTWWPSDEARVCIIYDAKVGKGSVHSNDMSWYATTGDHEWTATVYDPRISNEFIPQMEIDIISKQLAWAWARYRKLKVVSAGDSFITCCGSILTSEIIEGMFQSGNMWAILWKDPQLRARLGTDIQPYIIADSSGDQGYEEAHTQVSISTVSSPPQLHRK